MMIKHTFLKLASALLFTTMIMVGKLMYAQVIPVSPGNTITQITENNFSALGISNSISEIHASKIKVDNGDFLQLKIEGYSISTTVGHPGLPILSRLIEVPVDAELVIEIGFSRFKDISLSEMGLNDPIFPAQPSLEKLDQPESPIFQFNNDIYNTDDFLLNELVQVESIGILRGVRVARIVISPVNYNPAANIIRVYDYIELKIRFNNGSNATTVSMKQKMNPYFSAIKNILLNYQEPEETESLFQADPISYIIVSDPMFREVLQPFVEWKTRKGFRVVEAYTDNPEIGNTTASIKNYLTTFYQNPPEGYQPQSFVLFVGDVAQVPSFAGATGNHVTDLYYCEYTGDVLPDAFYGRFSAQNIAQLQPQIDKTLEYEQYLFPDPSFLDEVVMIAGQDSFHQLTWGNGQVNYGNTYYFNVQNGINSHTYLQPEPTGGNYSFSIRQNVSNGVGFANYSAHCSAAGWANPSFTINHIQALQNQSKYPLMIGNCCSSVEFQNNSFGEDILRAAGKGAIGYIGGSNSTYWDEDFWWAVGFKAVSANPQFANGSLGAFDRILHSQPGITIADWHITQGQIPTAGNLAVTQSGSTLTNYYWEIYHLMGDPSLMAFFSQPPDCTADYPALIPLGSNSVTINSFPHTYVSITKDNVLLGAGFADANGVADINLIEQVITPGDAEIIITGQQLKPYFGTLLIASPDGAYVLVKEAGIDDQAAGNGNGLMEYAETFSLNLTYQNYGQVNGENIQLMLQSSDEYVTIINGSAEIQSIEGGGELNLSGQFEISLKATVPDQHTVIFTLVATDGTDNWSSNFSLKAYAPQLELAGFAFQEIEGNSNGKFDANEKVRITVYSKNNGNAAVTGTSGLLLSTDPYISIITSSPQDFGDAIPGQVTQASFEVYADESTPPGHPANFVVNLFNNIGVEGTGNFNITIGPIPMLIIDLDGNHNSAPFMREAANQLGVVSELVTEIPADLSYFSSVFVALGVYNSNRVLSAVEGQQLADYLALGGKVYMEGGDTWYYDPVTPVHPLFGIYALSDGAGNLDSIVGTTGAFAEGLKMKYTGDNNWIDQLQAVNGASVILQNNNPGFSCGIARIGNGFKTIGTSFEFGGLFLEDQRVELMQKYLDFFEINVPATLTSIAYTLQNNLCNGDTTQMFVNITGGSGDFTILWTPQTGLSNPNSRQTDAYPEVTTVYTAVITDNLTGVSMSHQIMIVVKELPSTPEIVQAGLTLVSDATAGNQWYNDDGIIEGATGQIFTPTKTSNYYTIVTNSLGCTSEMSNVIYFQSTFINEPILPGSLRIYPNPSDGLVNIDFVGDGTKTLDIQVYSAYGQPLKELIKESLKLSAFSTMILDMSGLPAGVYYIKLFDGERLQTKKLILSN